MSKELIEAITEMREEDAVAITTQAAGWRHQTPSHVLDACREAMGIIGKRFETGECFIPELILAGEILGQISAIVKPRMQQAGESKKLGKIVLGTVQGDIHDIAKDIVGFMLDINGFEVTDLGVDVPPAKFVEAVKQTGAKIVGLSGFLTLAFDPMKDTVAGAEGCRADRCQGHDRRRTDRREYPPVHRRRRLWQRCHGRCCHRQKLGIGV